MLNTDTTTTAETAVNLELLRSIPTPADGNFVTTADPEKVISFLEAVKEAHPDGVNSFGRTVLGFKMRRNWVGIESRDWMGRGFTTYGFRGGAS